MSVVQDIEKITGRIYTDFLYRDLIYIGGGLLILSVPALAFSSRLSLDSRPWWFFGVVLLAAYALGFFAQETTVALGIYRMYPRPKPIVEQEAGYVLARKQILAAGGETVVLGLERIILLKHLSAVLGSSSVFAFLLLQVHYWTGHLNLSRFVWLVCSILLVVVAIVMGVRNWRAASVQAKIVEAYCSGDTKKPSPTTGSTPQVAGDKTPDD